MQRNGAHPWTSELFKGERATTPGLPLPASSARVRLSDLDPSDGSVGLLLTFAHMTLLLAKAFIFVFFFFGFSVSKFLRTCLFEDPSRIPQWVRPCALVEGLLNMASYHVYTVICKQLCIYARIIKNNFNERSCICQ